MEAMPTRYMNVWRNTDGSHQWTDGDGAVGDRDFCDRVAAEVEGKPVGIKRMAILRITPKAEPTP